MNERRKRILDEPSYWLERLNGILFDAITRFMEENAMKKKDLAKHLGISRGRVSQILNDGEINLSLEKVISIALRLDLFPVLSFIDKATYFENAAERNNELRLRIGNLGLLNTDSMERGDTLKQKTEQSGVISMFGKPELGVPENELVLEYA